MIIVTLSGSNGTLRRLTIDELREILPGIRREENVIWVDLAEPTPEEEDLVLRDLFQFHPLTIADCRAERVSPNTGDHLPKVEDYGEYIYSIINPIELLEKGDEESVEHSISLVTRQINVYIGESYIVTHHYEPSGAISDASASCERNPQLFARGPDFIYHLILDDIVNQYSPILDRFDALIDQLEDELFHEPTRSTMLKILVMKRAVFRLRRITTYQREMVYRLSRGEFTLITTVEIAFYRNVYDHLVRAVDLTESYRDILTSLLDAYLSFTSYRLNEVMKFLTVLATFFLPLTFIAGVYGMNFEFMPELHWRHGYLFAWGIMIAVAIGMFIFFRRKKWL